MERDTKLGAAWGSFWNLGVIESIESGSQAEVMSTKLRQEKLHVELQKKKDPQIPTFLLMSAHLAFLDQAHNRR